MMRAEQSLPEPKDVYKVSVWKWKPDASAPWWQRWYFRFVYLPFQNFSFGVMGIPSAKEVTVESDERGNVRRTFSWYEDIAIFEDEERADRACLDEPYGYKRQPFNRMAPRDSAQYSGTVFPRKKDPRKWASPTLSLVIRDRKQDEQRDKQLAECLREINQVLSK